ncbi:carbon-nitrogen hydrolase [Aspergillus carlsbadensis]|nr:carbon-nitrogen hydrolase [Aspergillus carlsbadensis]
MRLPQFSLVLPAAALAASLTHPNYKTDKSTGFEWDPGHFKVAAVRYPPANYAYPLVQNRTWVDLDLNATVDKAIEIIHQAGAEGVKLMAFPELYFPGFPIALNFEFTPANLAHYASQAMAFEGPEWNRLTAAISAEKMYAVVSFAEPDDGALYMGQYLVGPDGKTIHRHRKLRPSGSERNLFSDGVIESIRAVTLPFGTVTMLSCWENLWPTMRYTAAAQPANLHIASFPWGGDANAETLWWEHWLTHESVVRSYAASTGVAAIMPAIGKSSIFNTFGVDLNRTDATDAASLEAMPYITGVFNTTTWAAPSYDVNGQHSWAALVQILQGLAPDVPRVWGAFFDRYVTKIKDFSAYYVVTEGNRAPEYAAASGYRSLYESYGQVDRVV